jgi:addiction module HigA family antidote
MVVRWVDRFDGLAFSRNAAWLTLKDELAARGLSASALALKLCVWPQRLYEIIRGERAITPDTALRLGRFFGNSAEFWMSLQTSHDLEMARRTLGERIEREVEAA